MIAQLKIAIVLDSHELYQEIFFQHIHTYMCVSVCVSRNGPGLSKYHFYFQFA